MDSGEEYRFYPLPKMVPLPHLLTPSVLDPFVYILLFNTFFNFHIYDIIIKITDPI